MPSEQAKRRAEKDKREGKAPSTQAGEFVREEIDHVREGKHGARSPKQAIAIGLSKARRAGVKVPPPPPAKKGRAASPARKKATRELEQGQRSAPRKRSAPKRKRASAQALQREGRDAASPSALSKQAHDAPARRGKSTGAKRGAQSRAKRGRRATPRGESA